MEVQPQKSLIIQKKMENIQQLHITERQVKMDTCLCDGLINHERQGGHEVFQRI
jgi:hypothetical protein